MHANDERAFHEAWKAVRIAPDKPTELYDLEADIGEQNNVAIEHPGVVAEMQQIIKEARGGE